MKNKKYKREEFAKYFYGLNPRVENLSNLDPILFIDTFEKLRVEQLSLHELHLELNETFKNEYKNKSKR